MTNAGLAQLAVDGDLKSLRLTHQATVVDTHKHVRLDAPDFAARYNRPLLRKGR